MAEPIYTIEVQVTSLYHSQVDDHVATVELMTLSMKSSDSHN
jgi:hypothetical protein